MKVTTDRSIWCERCQAYRQERNESKPKFIHAMRLAGWRTRLGKTCCPECVKELADGKLWPQVGDRK